MWIQVRSMDGKTSERLDGLSKLTKIEDLRDMLVDPFDAPVERQRLFYRGKMLVDGHSLFDYDVGLNALIQLMIRPAIALESKPEDEAEEKEEEKMEEVEPAGTSGISDSDSEETLHSTYRMGDIVDGRDETMGAWFESKILKITKRTPEDDKDLGLPEISSSQNNETSEKNVTEKISAEVMDIDQNDNIKENEVDKNSDNIKENTDIDTNETIDSIQSSKNITNIAKDSVKEGKPSETESCPFYGLPCDGYVYHVKFDGYEEDSPVKLLVRNLRPRCRNKISFDKLKIGDKVMVNYNYDDPESRGYWYDAVITNIRNTRTIKELYGTVYIGKDLVPFENCQILFRDEAFRIEEAGCQLNVNQPGAASLSPAKRQSKPECDHCNDNPRRKCKFCSCSVCGDKKEPEKQVLCDECDQAYHLYCLKPALTEVPDVDEWYCPACKNDATEVVQAGEKLKESKKKAKMASALGSTTRDWGRGMACVGRTKFCNIVKPNHFGPIPGVEVGQMWKFRVQVSEAGVHRPHVAGIHGREDEGAYSLVLSGGYEDDVDRGVEFTYTGSGGRDLSGNKRTAEQSCDQTLTRMNRALAKNCDANIDAKNGAEAKDWRKGKPVRVVRNVKGRKHSKFAPEEGNRYDGIFKIVKYWPDKGKSGFIVWRYLLRRDDPVPAPWTKEGKKRIEELGLEMEIPEGYREKEQQKLREKENGEEGTPAKGKGKGRKRKRIESDSENEESIKSPPKKKQSTKYKVPSDISKRIKEDKQNEKLWVEALQNVSDGVQKFLSKVEELFVCICCQEIVFQPVTTECGHNLCKPCLQRSFKAEVYSCPACRSDLGSDHSMQINKALSQALNGLYPGYEAGR